MAGVMTTGQFSNNFNKTFKKLFMDEYTRRTPEYEMLFKTENHNEQFLKEGDMATLGTLEAVAEGQGGNIDAFKQGNSKTQYFTEYKLNAQITEATQEDDLFSKFSKIPGEMAKSASETVEYLFWDLINSNTDLGLDGKVLFASDHPYVNYGANTQSNTATNSFSYSALQTAIEHFHSLKNERGLPLAMYPNHLVIPYQLQWLAEEILGNGAEMKPGTADNDINAIKSLYDIKYSISHYLTSSTGWTLYSPDHDLRWIWRRSISDKSWDDDQTGNKICQVKFRAAASHFHWRGAYRGNA